MKKLDPSYDSNSSDSEELSPPLSEKAPHHHYQITTISIAVQQFIDVANSYRGISKTFRLFSSYFPTEIPHYSTIKKWVERLGLYALEYYPKRRVEITRTPTAFWVKSVLEYISYRYGFPRQIICS